jgi:hypothetical protein
LRAFGGDIDRATARMLLKFWKHLHQLSPREGVAVLKRLPRKGEQAATCVHCGWVITRPVKADGSGVGTHADSDTVTGIPQRSCGEAGELGTEAEPMRRDT